ncbi:ankyrin repeat domain-containing protein [Bartonella sp. HY761]|uniref:ankyrin repeat domain-containing protein n=1 Tax=Bartonella sp. HY761 TaxID=2979330 RepID=UPI0021E1F282|nr:ankyrin repeat domain-containing protein [Bartonella sp. HY761]UXN07941.1 ankyrin repeat domain-containing protein [Bartonella sp. HY761]
MARYKKPFENTDINARDNTYQETALFFDGLSDEITLWLIEQGININARDRYGRTVLHHRSQRWHENLVILLENNADVNALTNDGNTPLHEAVALGNLEAAKILVEFGADINLRNSKNYTALEYGLQQCSNIKIADMAELAEFLLKLQNIDKTKKSLSNKLKGWFSGNSIHSDGQQITTQMQDFVKIIGQNFEFHRENFNKTLLEEASFGLEKLYQLFNVEPIGARIKYDGHSPIIAKGENWQQCHEYLWQLLVPSSGPCTTMQGEVIRIASRLSHEIEGNGGGNYDQDYQKMAVAFLNYLKEGKALSKAQLDEVAQIINAIKDSYTPTDRLTELGVKWVGLNSNPIQLPKVNYKR